MSTTTETPKHTPGPWMASGPYGRQESSDPLAVKVPGVFDIREKSETVDGRVHAQVHVGTMHSESLETARANARLIAAAPDLLDALRILEEFVTELTKAGEDRQNRLVELEGDKGNRLFAARAAIAKATGGVA